MAAMSVDLSILVEFAVLVPELERFCKTKAERKALKAAK